MELEFPICIAEEEPGRLTLCREDLWVTVQARSPLRGEGLCKLWLLGERGKHLLGTMIPEKGVLHLGRRLSMREVMETGTWPPVGVEAELIWELDLRSHFPRTDLFCFARVKEKRLSIRFDREGQPLMPEEN